MVYLKDPDSTTDYTVDWSDYLATGEAISLSAWGVTPTGVTVDSDTNTTTSATALVSGGTEGVVYKVTNEIVTDQGRTVQRSVYLRVEEL